MMSLYAVYTGVVRNSDAALLHCPFVFVFDASYNNYSWATLGCDYPLLAIWLFRFLSVSTAKYKLSKADS